MVRSQLLIVGVVSGCGCLLAAITGCAASRPAPERVDCSDPLPKLDKESSSGLRIDIRVGERFKVGDGVNMWCTITNTTDSVKPIGWTACIGNYFRLVRDGQRTMSGILPRPFPQIDKPLLIKSIPPSTTNYVFYLPPGESLAFMMSYKADRPGKFKGRIVYDPVPHGSITLSANGRDSRWDTCAVSNMFEYQVEAASR